VLIIFDCDGVLRSASLEAMYTAYLAIAKYLEKDPADFWQDLDEFKKWHNNDWHYNLQRMGVPLGSNYLPFNKIFHDIYDPCIVRFPWVEEVLEHLSQNHTLTVLSGAKYSSVFETLKSTANYFVTIKGSDHVRKIKPDPEGIHLIMDEIGFDANDTVMIGDSEADILAGKRAGVMTVGVTWGMTDRKEMQELAPDHIFHDPMQLKSF